jgi:hypothetical protein
MALRPLAEQCCINKLLKECNELAKAAMREQQAQQVWCAVTACMMAAAVHASVLEQVCSRRFKHPSRCQHMCSRWLTRPSCCTHAAVECNSKHC